MRAYRNGPASGETLRDPAHNPTEVDVDAPMIRDNPPKVAPNSRAERALALYGERGSLIRSVAADTFEVPSCGFRGKRYIVHYGGSEESCSCPDFQYRGNICKHLLCIGIMHAARRSGVREVRTVTAVSGDPFKAAGMARPDLNHESSHGCYSGWVYMGWEDPETGEEELERVPCKRCHS